MPGWEVDPDEEARRRALEGPYAPGSPMPATAGPYGIGPVPELVEHQERPRQGATQGAAPEPEPVNPYGYPERLDLGEMPEEPVMRKHYYWTGGLASKLSRGAAQNDYDKALAKYKREVGVRREKEETYNRDYTAAERRETRARLEREQKERQADREADNKRLEAMRQSRDTDRMTDNERLAREAASRAADREADNRRLSRPKPPKETQPPKPPRAAKAPERKFYSDLWKAAVQATAKKDEYGETIPGNHNATLEEYNRLKVAAGVEGVDQGPADITAAVPSEPKRMKDGTTWRKRNGQWELLQPDGTWATPKK